jgi:hypothetical protein
MLDFFKKHIVVLILFLIVITIVLTQELILYNDNSKLIIVDCEIVNISIFDDGMKNAEINFKYKNETQKASICLNAFDDYKFVIGGHYYYKFKENYIDQGELLLNDKK